MHICIDSCVFINRLRGHDPAVQRLISLIGPTLQLVVPRLVVQEVTRNLRSHEQVRRFFQLFHQSGHAFIVDEPVPINLVNKYVELGLPAKADAFIGAFAEWMQVRYLVSDNRHFLRDLRTDAFDVLDAAEFVSRWESGIL
ncbi:MAG: PIN domain-containing protein [Chloroflexia bacterium]|nr:PIN domain-containing protein [Chloroflexia bacterium]